MRVNNNGNTGGCQWFSETTPNSLKRRYHELALLHHPDRGGDTRLMQEINAAYLSALSRMDGLSSKEDDGKNHTYQYCPETEQAIIDMISNVIVAKLAGVTLELIGSWLWVGGNTKPHKGKLGKKGMGFMWHQKRELWYWKPAGQKWHKRSGSFAEMDSIRSSWGSRPIDLDDRQMTMTRV
jgi:hypothetical protein